MGTERVARVDSRGDRVDVVRELREQDDVGAAADSGVEGDPPRIPSHHLDDHDAPVRLGRRVQAIDGVGGKGHRGIEPEAIGGADDVVVDRLRHADDWDAELAEPMRKAERAVAANHHEAAKSHAVKHLDDPVGVFCSEPSEVVIRRTNGSPVLTVPRIVPPRRRMPVTSLVVRTRAAIELQQAVEAVFDADHVQPGVDAGLDDGADHSVQTRRVTAAGEDPDFIDGF